MLEKWYGTLTLQNLEEVATMIRDLLDGKRYTFVACNEAGGFVPDVRTGQELNHENSRDGNALSVWLDEEEDPPRFGGFNISDSYGVWGCSTSINTEGYYYDHERDAPYIAIGHDQVKIEHRAPAGHLLYWVAAVER